MSDNKTVKPFGIKDKMGYLFGDFGNDFTFIFASTYVMVFYTKVMGISAGLVGLMFVVARCVDAFTDVGMGRIIDQGKAGKHGRYRTWILRMSGPVAISSFLMYQSSLASLPYNVKVVYMFVTYLLWGSVFYTSINIPYGSMAAVMSTEPKDRSSLSVFRSMGAMIAGMTISIIAPIVVYTTDASGNQVVDGGKLTLIAGIFSVCAIACYLICFALVSERVEAPPKAKEDQQPILVTFKQVFTNRSLLGVVCSALLMLLASLMGQGLQNFLYADYFNNTTALAVAPMLTLPVMFILAAVSTKLATKYGKKECSIVGLSFAAVMYFVMGFLHITNVWVYVGISFVTMLGVYFFSMQTYALVTDVIDDIDVKTGERNDATIYGVYSFSRKIGQAFAGGLVGASLSFIGYDSLATVQTEAVKNGIYNISTFGTGLLYLLCVLAIYFIYPLSKDKVDANVAELKARRESKNK